MSVADPPWPPVGVVRTSYARTEETPLQSALNPLAEGTVELVDSAWLDPADGPRARGPRWLRCEELQRRASKPRNPRWEAPVVIEFQLEVARLRRGHALASSRVPRQLQSVTCTAGWNRPWATARPRSIAWIARGVVTNRVISSADGVACWPGRVEMFQAP